MNIDNLFIELIRVSLGLSDSLSCEPGREQWETLFFMARKQSLTGVCYMGAERLSRGGAGIPYDILAKWYALAAGIAQLNRTLDRQCTQVQEMLRAQGFRSAIIKGQSMAALYPRSNGFGDEPVSLRQPGDIDVWVDASEESMLSFAADHSQDEIKDCSHHVETLMFGGTSVEFHYRLGYAFNLFKTRRLLSWANGQKSVQMGNPITLASGNQVTSPTPEFNLVFLIVHMHKHFFNGGIGLRQVMDYYLTLKSANLDAVSADMVRGVIGSLGMTRFSQALTWVLEHVFGSDPALELWTPDEKRGKVLMQEIFRGGNFGMYDKKYVVKRTGTKFTRYLKSIWNIRRFALSFPREVCWYPFNRLEIFLVYHLKNLPRLSEQRGVRTGEQNRGE